MLCQDDLAIMLYPKCTELLNKANHLILNRQLQTLDWQHFENYKSFLLQVFVIEKQQLKWRCSCYDFGLKHFCIHEHAARWRYDGGELGLNIPNEHRRTEVLSFRRRGKGRPSRVPSSLERVPCLIPQEFNDDSDFE